MVQSLVFEIGEQRDGIQVRMKKTGHQQASNVNYSVGAWCAAERQNFKCILKCVQCSQTCLNLFKLKLLRYLVQIRRAFEDSYEIIILVSQQKHML